MSAMPVRGPLGRLVAPARVVLAGVTAVFLFTAALLPAASGAVAHASSLPATSPAAPTKDGRATFGIKPSHASLALPIDSRSTFDFAATPGASQVDHVAISNDALTPVDLSIYASDAFNTDSDGYDLLAASQKPVDIGRWISLPSSKVRVPARSTVVVPFTLHVPAGVTPGDHDGGIVVSLRTTVTDKKGDRVAVDHRVGVRVYMRVQGPLDPRLTISQLAVHYHRSWWNPFAAGRATVTYVVRNTGDVRLGAHQTLTLSGSYGASHTASIPDLPELLPGNSHRESITVKGAGAVLRDRGVIRVIPFSLPGDTDGPLTTEVRVFHVWTLPWVPLVLLLLVLGGCGGVVVRRRRQSRRPVLPAEKAPSVAVAAGQKVKAKP